MRKTAVPVTTVVLLSVMAIAPAVAATETRRCDAALAVFSSGKTEDVSFRLTLTDSDGAVLVKVHKSGEWSGSRTLLPSGAETVVFNTGAAVETLTIGNTGNFLWDIAYDDPKMSEKHVIAFARACRPWRPK